MLSYLIRRLREKITIATAKNNPSALYTPEQRQNPPIFLILSCGRSGTTLLRKLLMQSSSIHIPPESDDMLPKSIQFFLKYKKKSWQEKVEGCLAVYQNSKNFVYWDVDLFAHKGQLIQLPEDKQTLCSILEYIYQQHAKSVGAQPRLIGDKTPYLTLRLDWVLTVFPNAKVLHLVRDGRAVVASRMKSFDETIEQASQRWLWSLKEIEKLKKSRYPNLMELSYESLVTATEESIRQVCTFLEIPFEQVMLKNKEVDLGDDVLDHHANTKKAITTKYLDKWKQQLTTEEKKYLERVLAKQLKKRNYL